ncbi:MAG: histidinol-phosphate transaminase [Pseudomonadales bacterium]|jgi:histidinol-phosphate aminotransferase|nr:histidinol-phosphate transaminase [Pseudomonadales bacterium]
MTRFERDSVRRMQGYRWGEQPEDARTIKLNTNENPHAPSPAVARALAALDVADLRRYPSPFANGFRDAAAAVHGVPRDWIIATNGGDELLRLALTTFLEPGQPLATTAPSYSLYPVLASVQGSPTIEYPLDADFALPEDLGERANAAGAGLFCLVNPHAPSGRLFDLDAVDALARSFEGVLLLDEAYVDFVDPALGHDATRLLARHDNLLILRSLSKGYALAGLRFGYGLGQAELIEPMLTKTRDSYNVDLIAQRLATAAVEDRSWAEQNWAAVRRERTRLTAALRDLGCEVPASQTNFVLARLPAGCDARAVQQRLREARVLVRWFDTEGLRDRLRISVGTPEEDDRLLELLSATLVPA